MGISAFFVKLLLLKEEKYLKFFLEILKTIKNLEFFTINRIYPNFENEDKENRLKINKKGNIDENSEKEFENSIKNKEI